MDVDQTSNRPRGILKNTAHDLSSNSEPSIHARQPVEQSSTSAGGNNTPFDLTQTNTLKNAGIRRRSSSRHQSQGATSRRTSTNQAPDNLDSGRLKWDEANLYLTEQERTSTMKITEPKTPYAKRYEPSEDADELMMLDETAEDPKILDAEDLSFVDELDQAKGTTASTSTSTDQSATRPGRSRQRRESEIPGLELGEPEEKVASFTGNEGIHGRDDSGRIIRQAVSNDSDNSRSNCTGTTTPPSRSNGTCSTPSSALKRVGSVKGEKSVQVDEDAPDGRVHDGTVRHRDFEELRKRHYEMKGVKGILAHTSDDDAPSTEDVDMTVPAVPDTNHGVANGV